MIYPWDVLQLARGCELSRKLPRTQGSVRGRSEVKERVQYERKFGKDLKVGTRLKPIPANGLPE